MASFDPHALYSHLVADLRSSIDPAAFERMLAGEQSWPEISFRERAATSIYTSFLKKFKGGMTRETKQKALVKFLQVSDLCKNWEYRSDENPCDDLLLGEFSHYLWKFWHPDNLNPLVDSPLQMLERAAVGPGAGLGSPGGDFYSKLFSSRLTTTSPTLYTWYKHYIKYFPVWKDAEELRNSQLGEPEIVRGNRLSFVPKNDDISRTICTEPVLNMFFQLGFCNILSSRLADFSGINLESQQFKNRELARKGSFDESYVTIDLSSASDSMALTMLKRFLPSDFFRLLDLVRSPWSQLPDGTWHEGGMISTMGNGSTFPLQTILFTCVVLSAFKADGLAPIFPRGNCCGTFGVNGDDIVVPKRICAKVLRLLHLLGFHINMDKTFVEGPFRESCGGDYFEGRNLRGVYVKSLSLPQERYSVINQLNLFSARTGIPLKSTVQALTKTVKFLPVPFWENDDSGIRIPLEAVKNQLAVSETGLYLYSSWTSKPPPVMTILERDIAIPKSFKPRIFNPHGLMIALLQGSVNDNTISLKPKVKKYYRKRCVAPSWDCLTVVTVEQLLGLSTQIAIPPLVGGVSLSRLKTVTYLNLFG